MKKIVILGAGESGTGSAILAQKQGFEVFNQYSVYEHTLPLPEKDDSSKPILVREINRADRALFKEIENKTTPRSVLNVKGGGPQNGPVHRPPLKCCMTYCSTSLYADHLHPYQPRA